LWASLTTQVRHRSICHFFIPSPVLCFLLLHTAVVGPCCGASFCSFLVCCVFFPPQVAFNLLSPHRWLKSLALVSKLLPRTPLLVSLSLSLRRHPGAPDFTLPGRPKQYAELAPLYQVSPPCSFITFTHAFAPFPTKGFPVCPPGIVFFNLLTRAPKFLPPFLPSCP